MARVHMVEQTISVQAMRTVIFKKITRLLRANSTALCMPCASFLGSAALFGHLMCTFSLTAVLYWPQHWLHP